MTLPVVLFAVAALGGLYLALLRLRGLPFPMPVSIVHGLVAAAALVALAVQVLSTETNQWVSASLLLFVVAALGGFYAFSLHLRGKTLPIAVLAVHALVAVAGYASLLMGVYGV